MTFGINEDYRATPLRFYVHVSCYEDSGANAPAKISGLRTCKLLKFYFVAATIYFSISAWCELQRCIGASFTAFFKTLQNLGADFKKLGKCKPILIFQSRLIAHWMLDRE